ncbi:little elongation complex subunit 2 [Drosophila innubila]|uniref:little elongation complex subunit 2 n=1 Tax=Drosophila innubila TaxID=198719 RepID=UPI00148D82AD|nr:little elongation complex subunit 2 [Drosophila innubila]
MESRILYEGSSIFRNQPSYREFNKSFENANDTLFAFLNEVDSETLKEEQQAPSQVFTSYNCSFARKDPRTLEVVGLSVYDHTTEQLSYGFPNTQERYSVLSRAQQAACVRVLLAWQQKSSVSEDDFLVWRATNNKRCNEQQLVQKHIYNYAKVQQERLYAPMKPLVLLYSKWFRLRMEHLLQALPSVSYITHSGLPQLPQCKGLNVETASMEDIELLYRAGQVRLWPEVSLKQQELSSLRVRLERYVCTDVAAEHVAQSTRIAAELENQLYEADEDVFVLPLDAMLMLLTSGTYIDLPSEMLLKIRDIPDSDHKSIEFQQPFPAHNCGWHTNSRVLTEAYAAYAPTQWLQLNPDATAKLIDAVPIVETDAKMQQLVYKVHHIDENVQAVKQLKSNCALISWRLRTEVDQGLQIYSTLSMAAVRDTSAKQPLGCHLIKLENKPDCGCEIMTKYELLSAWLQLKLLQADVGHCSRISLRDFAPLLEEQLTLAALEEQLHEYYHISMPQQLCQMHEFLKLLRGMSAGEYLLRYTTKYKDKFLLCRPTLEPTPQSFKLQDLLAGTSPSNVNFLTQSNSYLPISPKLCSRLHEELQLLPCAFPAKAQGVSRPNKKVKVDKEPVLVQRTRTRQNAKPKNRKRKRSSTRQRKRAAIQAQKEEDKDLDKIMCL